jgi:hypothetical protein
LLKFAVIDSTGHMLASQPADQGDELQYHHRCCGAGQQLQVQRQDEGSPSKGGA